jgi:DNA polymerase elongation subunit (family B)
MLYYTNVSYSRNKILLRAIDGHTGEKKYLKKDFVPALFSREIRSDQFFDSSLPRTLTGEPLRKIPIKSIGDYWEYRKKSDDLYGDINPAVQYISKHYPITESLDYDINQVRIFNIDIEVLAGDEFPDPEIANRPINSISLYDNITDTMYVWGLEYAGCNGWKEHDDKYNYVYRPFYDEQDLIIDFQTFWMKNYPDIITGWYIDGFDIPYILNRTDILLGDNASKKYSPWGEIKEKKHSGSTNAGVVFKGSPYQIEGITNLDYMILYRKYSYTPQESYKLDHIAFAELGDSKLNYSEVESLRELYRTNYQKFIEYNIKDVDIVKRLDDKKKFLQLVVDMAYYARINYDDVASPIRIWDSLIYNHLGRWNIQISPESRSNKSGKYKGAFVKEPHRGKSGWILSIDLASLYPSLMRGINISPDTMCTRDKQPFTLSDIINKKEDLSWLKEDNLSLASNGVCFSRENPGFLPVLLTQLYEQRKIEKNKMLEEKAAQENTTGEVSEQHKKQAEILHVKQYAKKILLNSAYGAMGNPYFRWFDLDLAEAVTYSGQVAILWIERIINEYMNKILSTEDEDYVVYIDTDSIYLDINPLMERLPDMDIQKKVNIADRLYKERLKTIIDNGYQELYEYMNHFDQLMFMDREIIADKAIFCAPKHYYLRVFDEEGIRYQEPKLKVKGMAFIKSDVPKICRDKIKELLPITLDGENSDMIFEIDKFRTEFLSMKTEIIAKNTGVSKIEKYKKDGGWKKSTPIGSKSSIIYNKLHQKHNLGSKYPVINEGDKIKYVYLKRFNPIQEETVGFVDYLPEEFKLEEYVDKEAMFQKSFMGPVDEILNALTWSSKEVRTLEDFL